MIIKPAAVDAMPALMALRIESEEWLTTAGIDQWRDPATRARALKKWHRDIVAGRTWVVADGDRDALLATVTLAEADMDFWRPEDEPDTGLYVAKLITSRRAKGLRLGGRILDWVGSMARETTRPWVRLDCWRSNAGLQDFYLSQGFTHLRTEAPEHRLSGWMAQRSSSVVRHPDAVLRGCLAHGSA
ncbi:GNAT family N-acetyltransferase [Streptomyces sp. NPDC001939]